ncbi:MAG: hypothetical protein R3B96_06445 [Pirellulaceae bacterium]
MLLIDGGKGQLKAAMSAFRELGIEPPTVISLAKREEEIFLPGQSEPLRLVAMRSRCGFYNTSAMKLIDSPSITITCFVDAASSTNKQSAEPPQGDSLAHR